jgi:peptidoglycan/LPS O-acetylase OafA/YrhL
MAFLLNYVFIWALNYLSWIWLSVSTIVLSYILSWVTYTYIELPCSISKKQ